MEIKKTNPVTVLSFKKQVRLTGLQEFVRTKARELYEDAIHNNLEIMGPVYWVYYGMDGDLKTLFTLEIALPVIRIKGYEGNFAISTLASFKYLSAIHRGEWNRLPGTYMKIYGDLHGNGLIPSGECREIYIHIDFVHPENNITEVQVGLQN